MDKHKGVLLYGGGLDSTALLMYLTQNNVELIALHINYGQVAFEEEQLACWRYCKRYGVEYATLGIDLRAASPHASIVGGDGGDCMDGRNAVLIATAAMFAAARAIPAVYVGFHEEPPNAPFPDATEAGLNAMRYAVRSMFKSHVHILAPFMSQSREQIARRAFAMDPGFFEDTHTCYTNEPGGCGKCAHCIKKADFERQVRA